MVEKEYDVISFIAELFKFVSFWFTFHSTMTNTILCDNSRQHNSMVNSQRGHSKTIRGATYFQSLNAHTKNRYGRKEDSDCDQGKIRPKSTETIVIQCIPNTTKQGSPKLNVSPRGSPSKEGCFRFSPSLGGPYAGAKFSEPPAPASLPRPPSHWTTLISQTFVSSNRKSGYYNDGCHQAKTLLNVQA